MLSKFLGACALFVLAGPVWAGTYDFEHFICQTPPNLEILEVDVERDCQATGFTAGRCTLRLKQGGKMESFIVNGGRQEVLDVTPPTKSDGTLQRLLTEASDGRISCRPSTNAFVAATNCEGNGTKGGCKITIRETPKGQPSRNKLLNVWWSIKLPAP